MKHKKHMIIFIISMGVRRLIMIQNISK